MSSLGQRAAEAYEKQAIGARALRTAKALNPKLIGTPQLKTLARNLSQKFTEPQTSLPTAATGNIVPRRRVLNPQEIASMVDAIMPYARINAANANNSPIFWMRLPHLPLTGWRFRPNRPDLAPTDWKRTWTDLLRSPQAVHERFVEQNRRRIADIWTERAGASVPMPQYLDHADLYGPSDWSAANHLKEVITRDGAKVKQFKSLTNAMQQEWDRIALSGRHGIKKLPLATVPGSAPVLGSIPADAQPIVAYKGLRSGNEFPTAARAQPDRGSDGKGMWWSAYPAVSVEYAAGRSGVNNISSTPGAGGTVYAAPVSKLRQLGPHTPKFTPHVAQDTRGWEEHALPTQQLIGRNTDWGQLPHYESVFTAPQQSQYGHNLFQNIYQALPSGKGWMQTK